MQKMRIVSNGTGIGTKVLIDGVESRLPIMDIQVSIGRAETTATITVALVEMDVEVLAEDAKIVFSAIKSKKVDA